MPFRTEDKHSPELGAKILELARLLSDRLERSPEVTRITVVQSLFDMGSGCFFDDMENEDEAKGAIKVLDWILTGLNHHRAA